ncbi:hypothetical protein [Nonomuraea insulae]|uniref:DUF11 domain-containing protein n=1 Tax=Nonomuraea insulae TaxID=1616787 RepID=A0ABW1CF66_9ACTN
MGRPGITAIIVVAGLTVLIGGRLTSARADPGTGVAGGGGTEGSPAPPTPRTTSLRVTTSVSPDPVTTGARAVYALTVTNTGDQPADDVIVTGVLDRNLTPGPLPTGCSLTTRTITCGGPGLTIPAGRSVAYDLPVTTEATLQDGTDLTNRAHVTSTSANGDETEIVTRTRTRTDLALELTAPPSATAGESIPYTLTVTNRGPSQAENVTVQAPECLTCRPDSLAPDESRTFTFEIIPDTTGLIENCATVSTVSREEDTSDNRSCAATTVEEEPGPAAMPIHTATYTPRADGKRPRQGRHEREERDREEHEKDEPRKNAAAGQVPPPARHDGQALPLTGASMWMMCLAVAVLLSVGLLVRYFSRKDERSGRTG